MKKLALSIVAGLFATLSIAATRNDAKTEIPAKSESKSNSFANEYYVVAKLNATTYQLSDTPPDQPCNGNLEPCRITTAANHDSNMQISASEVNNPSQATIESEQDAL